MKLIKFNDEYYEEQHDIDCSFFIQVADEDLDKAIKILDEVAENYNTICEDSDFNSVTDYALDKFTEAGIKYEYAGLEPDYVWGW